MTREKLLEHIALCEIAYADRGTGRFQVRAVRELASGILAVQEVDDLIHVRFDQSQFETVCGGAPDSSICIADTVGPGVGVLGDWEGINDWPRLQQFARQNLQRKGGRLPGRTPINWHQEPIPLTMPR